jgi:hypothetical protein
MSFENELAMITQTLAESFHNCFAIASQTLSHESARRALVRFQSTIHFDEKSTIYDYMIMCQKRENHIVNNVITTWHISFLRSRHPIRHRLVSSSSIRILDSAMMDRSCSS